jgi:hypothetical protein
MLDQQNFHQPKQLDNRLAMMPRGYSSQQQYSYRTAMDFAYDQEQFLKNMMLEKEQQYHRERYLIS